MNTIFGLPMVLLATTQTVHVPDAAIADAQLRTINHHYMHALATADIESIMALTADGFLIMNSSGEWLDRTQQVDLLRSAPAANSVSVEDVRVRLFGAIALIHGLFTTSTEAGAVTRVRYTDVYHWSGAAWLLIHSQHTALRAGVSPTVQRGAPLTVDPWRRIEPTGDDESLLRMLNEHYVRAYREADVAWYDAHLSADYVVVNGSGSWSDRAAALQDFAQPSFATHMRTFPVDKVRVRRFGAIALIHAENEYELKDGRRGVSRYTDIWQRQPNGRWLCIAAHITPFKLPG
jgi:ketosteroid isomerase-like protein